MWLLNPLKRSQLSNYEAGIHKKLKSTDCQILELLIKNEGQAVSKEDIMSSVWEGRIVSESSLTQSIAQLRLMLGDSGKEQRVIKTLPRKGYMILPHLVQLVPLKTAPATIEEIQPSKELHQVDLEPIEIPSQITTNKSSLKDFYSYFSSHKIALYAGISLIVISVTLMNFWTYSVLLKKNTVEKKTWSKTTINNTSVHLKNDPRSSVILTFFEDNTVKIADNISNIFISSNPQQLYLSCIYTSDKLGEDLTLDFTLPIKYPFDQMKGLINEKCR
ncbi:winged helix-turn-helix domain-containing protein [Photobacterium swingsii]|uniref:winged helix-turn-helix domain-containing protein n=1 Tax=Photobacterium swingsii TaxID=680026 RepID=UPI003D116B60